MITISGAEKIFHVNWLKSLMRFLVPPRCLKCALSIQNDQALCTDCWKELTFITTPYCACCGYPFSIAVEDNSLCGPCHQKQPLYAMARSALYYDDHSKPLILRFKHADATHLTPLLGQWLYNASHDILKQTDYIVPIPLHWRRLFSRRYNQAALLTLALARLSGKAASVTMMTRMRHTPFQGQLSTAARHDNVHNAFSIKPSWQAKIIDKNITLIDDVMTSGATINSCTRVLLKAGVRSVNVLTLARVV